MSDNEQKVENQTLKELVIRLDERVKQLCETADENINKIGQLEEKSNSNQQKIEEQIENDIDDVENEIAWNRRYYIVGIVILIAVGFVKDFWL